MADSNAVEMKQIVKRFGTVLASDHVDFSASTGEIHALLGENGAGKSTIMSMLSGVYRADSGEIRVHGQQARIRSPKDAMAYGIGMVFQHFRLVPTLTAAENIILGEKNGVWRGKGWMKRKNEQIRQLASQFGLSFPVDRPVWQLSVGEQQRVEIVKTLYRGADIIILDEPTSVLTPGEAEQLFATLKQMKDQGKTVIVTTHKLKEVMAVADRISVMRKGRMLQTIAKAETNERELARLMVGREIGAAVPERACTPGEDILLVEDLVAAADHGQRALKGLNLRVRQGEIVGIAGVAGNGQKELAEVLAGLRSWQEGRVVLNGKPMSPGNVKAFLEQGTAHIPENRMHSGLAGNLGAVDNLLLKSYRTKERSRFGMLRSKENRQWSKELIEQFDVKTPDLNTPVRQLSGGNQQKLLFAREIERRPRLMVAVHPTQGLDVGAAESVHRMLIRLRDEGSGVLLISEDLDELLQLSDRILVLYNGVIRGETSREEADLDLIGMWMAGVAAEEEVEG